MRRLATQPGDVLEGLPGELVSQLRGANPRTAEQVLLAYLDRQDIEMLGTRSPREIAESVLAMVEDAGSKALPPETVALIQHYLDVRAPARAAGARLADLMQEHGVDLGAALTTYQRRLRLLAESELDLADVEFSAEFGRTIQYYTGFVFEVIAEPLGSESPVAGGGRYDNLMQQVGARAEVPAVGAMIHTERLLAVAGNGARHV